MAHFIGGCCYQCGLHWWKFYYQCTRTDQNCNPTPNPTAKFL